jgi:hypothetical protein
LLSEENSTGATARHSGIFFRVTEQMKRFLLFTGKNMPFIGFFPLLGGYLLQILK